MPAIEPSLESRLPIWQALSELFLDTEQDEQTWATIAQTLKRYDIGADEAEAILWNEVYPVLSSNLMSIAGEWAGWSDDWLRENLAIRPHTRSKPRFSIVARMVAKDWQRVLAHY